MKKSLLLLLSVLICFGSVVRSYKVTFKDYIILNKIEQKIKTLSSAKQAVLKEKVEQILARLTLGSRSYILIDYVRTHHLSGVTGAKTADHVRSAEAVALAEKSDGKIVLRPDGKIDFPQIGFYGAQRLHTDEPTDLTGGIVQGEYVDQYGHTGVKGLTYMNAEKAKSVAEKQGLQLCSKTNAQEKTKQLFTTLGTSEKEQADALSILFGADLSGFRHPDNQKRSNVGSRSSLGLSEANVNESVSSMNWYAGNADPFWGDQDYPQPFLAFEEITDIATSDTSRSPEALALAEKSDGKIILRADGKIDFPEIGLYGAQRLHSDEPTDLTGGIVQGEYVDQYGHTGVKGLTYMNAGKAMEVTKKQGVQLFSKETALEKTRQFLAVFGTTDKEKIDALSIFFGPDLSGFRDPINKAWHNVGSGSYLELSEVNGNDAVCEARWYRDVADHGWGPEEFPKPYLAFENIEN